MKTNILCTLDNLVIYVEKVTEEQFEHFSRKLSKMETFSEVPEIYFSTGTGFSEYHDNLNIGQGSGALRIGYKHNSSKKSIHYTMRIEFNPSKQIEKHYKAFWSLFKTNFKEHRKLIKQLDIAFDLNATPTQIISASLTGRQRSMIKDTVYFGSRGNNGRLKIYNKKKEIEEHQKIKMPEDVELTRIEYTWKFDKGIIAQMLSKQELKFSEQYKISLLDIENLTGEVKSMILAYHNGWVRWNEFTRTSKNKIKRALDNMELLDIDHVFKNAQEKIVKEITSYFK